ncbi:apelin receptor early endogenous ligand [Loxodonta africana]|uniref:apelin receptor early endogenous ligand n=1 Tax=Loxodonta africana TaxID=9785 RepID=UPI0005404A5C|nr:apelin receptor early endogenous ligand [Loxodonta africana]XP_049708648.1 apelin receptor early endogenous ligand [Elephas maximus indicus]
MRCRQFFFIFFILIMSLLINGQRPANFVMRRKLHRQNCLQRRCMPLHSRVPFP